MGKVKKPSKPPAMRSKGAAVPDHLKMELFAPGMSLLHRAGLGGLACTLKAMERQYEAGLLSESKLPAPFHNDKPPWEIDERSVTLHFGKPETAEKYLKKLFEFAFQIKGGVIYLPGQYGDVPPSLAIRSELQNGLLLTLYDHGPQSRSIREVIDTTVEVDEKPITFRVARLEWYKHNRDGAKLAAMSLIKNVPLSRMLYPGAIVRHDRFKDSALEVGARILVPLLFAPVGVFALRMGAKRVTIRGKRVQKPGGVLVIPDYSTLCSLHDLLPFLIPRDPRATRVGSMSDAILAAEVRLEAAERLNFEEITCIRSIWCCAADWQSQLQPPSAVIEVSKSDTTTVALRRYAVAAANLPTRVRTKVVEVTTGRGKSKLTAKREEHFLTDSIVRPLIAENLAHGRSWYVGFTQLMTKINPATDKPYRNQLPFERKGLHDMISNPVMWDSDSEKLVVKAVHEAISYRLGQIRKETDGDRPLSKATKNRWDKFRERLRIGLGGAKTQGQLRFALCDLFSRAGRLPSLKDDWHNLLPMLSERQWQHTRDLALLACASYSGKEIDSDDEVSHS